MISMSLNVAPMCISISNNCCYYVGQQTKQSESIKKRNERRAPWPGQSQRATAVTFPVDCFLRILRRLLLLRGIRSWVEKIWKMAYLSIYKRLKTQKLALEAIASRRQKQSRSLILAETICYYLKIAYRRNNKWVAFLYGSWDSYLFSDTRLSGEFSAGQANQEVVKRLMYLCTTLVCHTVMSQIFRKDVNYCKCHS